MPRTVSWFSCGAASAVATKIALETRGNVDVVYCDTLKREHPDNLRFLRDCEKWFGQEIIIVGSDKYDRDPDVVFRKTRFLVGPRGARCTAELKRALRHSYQRLDDVVVLGFTAEEFKTRHAQLQSSEPLVNFWPVLHERGLSKEDCLRIVADAGIELPAMYKLGYRNNNCIGCVKGGVGYWNKVRVDFPERFAEMAGIERELGRQINRVTHTVEGKRKRVRVYLDELPPDIGRYESEPDTSCGILCQTSDRR